MVQKRQSTIVASLLKQNIAFALSGSNATYLWIENTDSSAVRLFRNIEFIINREDIEAVILALAAVELKADQRGDCVVFRSPTTKRERTSDRSYLSGELVENSDVRIPELKTIAFLRGVPVIELETLVQFQLRRHKLDDRVDVRDLIDVGLVDQTWTSKLPPELAPRLQELLDTPDG